MVNVNFTIQRFRSLKGAEYDIMDLRPVMASFPPIEFALWPSIRCTEWRRIQHPKVLAIRAAMERIKGTDSGFGVFVLDLDHVMSPQTVAISNAALERKIDILAARDKPRAGSNERGLLNFGAMLIRNTPRIQLLLRALADGTQGTWDQAALNYLIAAYEASNLAKCGEVGVNAEDPALAGLDITEAPFHAKHSRLRKAAGFDTKLTRPLQGWEASLRHHFCTDVKSWHMQREGTPCKFLGGFLAKKRMKAGAYLFPQHKELGQLEL